MKEWVQEFSQRYWHGRLDTRLPHYMAILAILLLCNSLAQLTWSLVPVSTDVEEQLASDRPVVRRAAVQREPALAPKISQWNLFGKFEQVKKVEKSEKPIVVPETKLNLKLRGVFASEDTAAARAIIADAKNDEDSYRIGDQVPGGATLNEIYADRVILERDGRLETLRLPVESSPVAGGPATAQATSSNRESRNSRSPDRNINRGNVQELSANTQDNSVLLGQYRDALMNDPQSIMGLVNVRPHKRDGRIVGYRLRPGKDRALLRRFGLRSGDIVTAVNGVSMDNPVKALEVLRDLSQATSLTVDVERNGSTQSFSFQIQ